MFRITISSSILLLALSACLLPGGCDKQYAQRKLDAQSSQWQEVSTLIDDLREGGQARIDALVSQSSAEGTDEGRAAALRAMLTQIAQADSAALTKLDRFGDQVYRASLTLSSPEHGTTLYVLLVEKDGRLQWAGPN